MLKSRVDKGKDIMDSKKDNLQAKCSESDPSLGQNSLKELGTGPSHAQDSALVFSLGRMPIIQVFSISNYPRW